MTRTPQPWRPWEDDEWADWTDLTTPAQREMLRRMHGREMTILTEEDGEPVVYRDTVTVPGVAGERERAAWRAEESTGIADDPTADAADAAWLNAAIARHRAEGGHHDDAA